MDPEADTSEDPAMYDEDEHPSDMPESAQSGGANTKGAVSQGRTSGGNIRVAPEDDIAPADRDELRDSEDGQEQDPSFPARVQVIVTKGDRGALTIECIAQDGEMTIDNVYYFPTADLAEAKTADKDYARRSLYTGPPFGQLDEDLQVLLERYLEDRGINTHMALFIPDYIDMKEQNEYINWLDSEFSVFSSTQLPDPQLTFSRHEVVCGVIYHYKIVERLWFFCRACQYSRWSWGVFGVKCRAVAIVMAIVPSGSSSKNLPSVVRCRTTCAACLGLTVHSHLNVQRDHALRASKCHCTCEHGVMRQRVQPHIYVHVLT